MPTKKLQRIKMKRNIQPLFDTYNDFLQESNLSPFGERNSVLDYLESFPIELKPMDGYFAVRGFLRAHAKNPATFNSYRTQVERMLLWSLLIAKKPLMETHRSDAEEFIEFCLTPPKDWVSPTIKKRFIKNKESNVYEANPEWRPFTINVPKSEKTSGNEINRRERSYQMSSASVNQVFSVCSSFFQSAIDEGLAYSNPFRSIVQKKIYKQSTMADINGRSLTQLQWNYVIQTAEQMADENPIKHERTLFILATLFFMYLKPSDLTGNKSWEPSMGDFSCDTDGAWWLTLTGKNNKFVKISVRDEYIEKYLTRYRFHLGLSPLPAPQEKTPLLKTLSGRPGLTDRNIRIVLQEVFDRALNSMIKEGWGSDKVDRLRSASLYWLRHTSAVFDAPVRDIKDLQADLRHNLLSTTNSTYYSSSDRNSTHSPKGFSIKNINMESKESEKLNLQDNFSESDENNIPLREVENQKKSEKIDRQMNLEIDQNQEKKPYIASKATQCDTCKSITNEKSHGTLKIQWLDNCEENFNVCRTCFKKLISALRGTASE